MRDSDDALSRLREVINVLHGNQTPFVSSPMGILDSVKDISLLKHE